MAFSFIVCSAFRFLFSRKGPFSEATFVFLTCNLGRSARESSLLFRSVVDTAAWEAIVNKTAPTTKLHNNVSIVECSKGKKCSTTPSEPIKGGNQ
ncbi:hypothetical protein T10_2043 [Trichinella papuae]|uniref:Uncharacterized protein n=1 Tax=Trichinella papuae TaxID=268474 RepID=A0A0V1M4N3_9BILA|nr:hypothetical protein T10_2043 [Trichinella papuae]